nr:hypothetical protein [Tanacetum cinerariifolium]
MDMDTENVEESLKKTQAEGSFKRAGQELEQESAKKEKLGEPEYAKVADDDVAKLKRCLEIVPNDDDDVAIKAIPLSSKSPTIVDYKIFREGKNSYFKIIRADGNLQNYLTFGIMFKNCNREGLEVLRSIVKEMFKKIKPVDDIDNLLFQTLKTMFEPHVLNLEAAKIAQAKEISKLKKRVTKLEKRRKSRHAKLRRLKKGRMHDADMFRVDDLKGNEVFVDVREKIVEKEVSTADPVTTAGKVVTAASVEDSAAPTTTTIADVDDELTLAKTLIAIKATIDADRQLAKQIQEREQLSIDGRSKLLAELIESRRKYFASKRAEEIRNKPPTKAQQKSLMYTYMKNIEGFKQKDFKGKSFNDIKKIFYKVYKRVNTFVDVRLQVDYGVEMVYDLLRLIRRQNNEGYKHE